MRIYEDRYTRERLRFHVALRFIRLEARTQTIRLWTGLTDDRIRKLYRAYSQDAPGISPVRHRGKSPQQPAYFTRNARVRQESEILASLYRLLGALPPRPAGEPAPRLASPGRGELLCQAYEWYRALMASPLISFEHAVFLLGALWSGEELAPSRPRSSGVPNRVPRFSAPLWFEGKITARHHSCSMCFRCHPSLINTHLRHECLSWPADREVRRRDGQPFCRTSTH